MDITRGAALSGPLGEQKKQNKNKFLGRGMASAAPVGGAPGGGAAATCKVTVAQGKQRHAFRAILPALGILNAVVPKTETGKILTGTIVRVY